jgi:hypothetical protein
MGMKVPPLGWLLSRLVDFRWVPACLPCYGTGLWY